MENPIIKKRAVIERTGRKLIVEVAEDDSVYLATHFDNAEPDSIRLSRESLLLMLQALEELDFEVAEVEERTVIVTYEVP